MTVTVHSFKRNFPEFRNTDPDLIQRRIDQAELRVQLSIWGNQKDLGVGYMTAHLLSVSPEGEHARLVDDTMKDTYLMEYKRLRKINTFGAGRVI